MISGTKRGTNLFSPADDNVRPTSDRIKETIFNMISNYIRDSNFLDLYSGSGAIGIEALSRGATKTTFVERSKNSLEILNKNLSKTKFTNDAKVYNIDVNDFFGLSKDIFDIIFLDPPYKVVNIKHVINKILDNGLLKQNAIIIVEQAKDDIVYDFFSLDTYKIKKFSSTTVVIYKFCKEVNL